jgi:hypothetical protein
MRLRDFCGSCCALLCSVVPNATGATQFSRLRSIRYESLVSYEPRGREFESLQARQLYHSRVITVSADVGKS